MRAYTRDVLELTNGELCILRWLRISNGKATLSASAVTGNSLVIVPDRLLKAGYVRARIDQFYAQDRALHSHRDRLRGVGVQREPGLFFRLGEAP